jgi:hypothetical protein
MSEILPATSDGLEETIIESSTPEFGSQETREFTGPTASLQALRDTYLQLAGSGVNVGSLELRTSRGRGSLRVDFTRVWSEVDPLDQAVQELNAFDQVTPIYSAPYFLELDVDLIAHVRFVFEAQLKPDEEDAAATAYDAGAGAGSTWGTRAAGGKAWQLLGHLKRGQETYTDTVYEFVKTWRTSSTGTLRIASSDANTVQDLPTLSSVMSRLIDSLPDGEWLKKPTVVQSAGNGFFSVRVTYLWAKKWSVVYGGSETGL